MGRRIKLAAAGAAALVVVGCGTVALAANPTTTAPVLTAGTGSCTTNTAGVCTLAHTLGVVPDTVVVSPVNGTQKPYMLNTVTGSYTATAFQVRAMQNATTPRANVAITVSWVASKGTVAPPPPPATSTVVPPPTSTPGSSTVTPPPPTTSTVTPPPTTTTTPPVGCAKPTTFLEQDGGDFPVPAGEGDLTASSNSYYIHNNAWNWQGAGSGQHEVLTACAAKSWYVDDYGFAPNNGEVYMYPNSHLDVNGGNGKPLSTWNTITGRFAGKGPGTGSYDVAWDLWLNGLADKNSFELMVWTEYHGNAEPAGTKRGTFTDPSTGQVYDVWWDGTHTDQAYLAYISQKPQLSGTVDLRALIVHAQQAGYLPAGDTLVNQIDYGNEVRDTQGSTSTSPARFTLTDFGVTMK